MPIIVSRVEYNRFREYGYAVRKQLKVAVDKTAFDIANKAEAGAPYNTGKLAAGHFVDTSGEMWADVGNSTEYAHWVNFGTRYMAARPFFTNAVEAGRPILRAAVTQAIRTRV